jgi:hypothetical protein
MEDTNLEDITPDGHILQVGSSYFHWQGHRAIYFTHTTGPVPGLPNPLPGDLLPCGFSVQP